MQQQLKLKYKKCTFVLKNLYKWCCWEHQRPASKNEVSQKDRQTPRGPCRTQHYQDPFPWDHPGRSVHCAVGINLPRRQIGGWRVIYGVHKHIVHVHVEVYRKLWQQRWFYIVSRFKTQPAGDKSEEIVRSNMKVHRCHRLHTEKEERVMLLLVSAYLVWSLQCMPRLLYSLNRYQVQHF